MNEFMVYTVSSYENLQSALNKWANDKEWNVFQVLSTLSDERLYLQIILQRKTKKEK